MIFSKDVKAIILIVWPLIFGLAMIMTGNGLQGTLLGIRAGFEGFPVFVTGIVMSLYYGGYVVGCHLVPKIIDEVGYIRTFAGLASLASTTILLHGVFIDPWLWGFARVLSGICFAGLYVVSESWLNNIAPNKYRGQIFGIYIFVINFGLFAGQFLINLADISEISLFILVSILVSLSMIPITLANKPSPDYTPPERLKTKKVVKSSPFSVLCVSASGLIGGALLGLGPAYATQIGFDVSKTALFIAVYILGCAAMPLAAGYISDHFDRRRFLIFLALAGLLTIIGLVLFPPAFFVLCFLLGGIATSLYSVAIAFMNDRIKESQRISASATLIMMNGIGACFGPIVISLVMQKFGVDLYFPMMGIVLIICLIFGLYRDFEGEDINVDDQTEFVPVPTRSSFGAFEIQDED